MLKIALIGNCQVQSLAISAAAMLDNVALKIFDYSQPYSRAEENRKRFAGELDDMDCVFAQPAILSFTSHKDLRPAMGDKLVTIANFYFRGLFPDSCYVGDFEARLDEPTVVNSVVVLNAFRQGLSEAEAVRDFNIESFDRLGLLDAWSSSMAEMRTREADGEVDVPAADFMEEACRRYHAFLTMNHPSGRLITDYLSRVLDHVGIRHSIPAPGSYRDILAEHDITPIYDFVADHHALEYRTLQTWTLNSLGRRFTSRESFTAAFYAGYSAANPATLFVHSPTDMVASLLDSPHRYLVDSAAPVTTSRPTSVLDVRPGAEVLTGRQLALTLRPVGQRLDELSRRLEEANRYIHKVHSFAETADPKLERLVHQSAIDADERRELRQEVRLLATQVRDLTALTGNLGGLAGNVRVLVAIVACIEIADVLLHILLR